MLPHFTPIVSPEALEHIGGLLDEFQYAILPYYLVWHDDPTSLKHELSKYDVEWILSSIMPDEALLRSDIHIRFLEFASKMGVRHLVVWDMPTYLENYEDSLRNTEISINRLLWFRENYQHNIIPLAKGAYPEQLRISLENILGLGYEVVAFHVSEYLTSRLPPYPYIDDKTLTAKDYMMQMIKVITEYPFNEILLIGVGNPKTVRELDWDDRFRYAGYSWYIDGKNFRLYTGEKVIDVGYRYFECSCPACKYTPPLIRRRTSLPGHNLLIIRGVAEDEEVIEPRIYELIADHHEDILIISGLYVGNRYSRWREAIKVIEEMEPSHLIFLGNTFHVGEDTIYNMWREFLEWLVNYCNGTGTLIHVVKGVWETWPVDILKNRYTVYLGVEDPLQTRLEPEEKYPLGLLHRFYTPSWTKMHIRKYTLDGSIDIYVYTLNKYHDTLTPEEAEEWLTNEKRFKQIDMLYTDLTTYPILNQEEGIGSPGIWLRKIEARTPSKPGAIHINNKGEAKLITPEE